jgi:hypothetical protein
MGLQLHVGNGLDGADCRPTGGLGRPDDPPIPPPPSPRCRSLAPRTALRRRVPALILEGACWARPSTRVAFHGRDRSGFAGQEGTQTEIRCSWDRGLSGGREAEGQPIDCSPIQRIAASDSQVANEAAKAERSGRMSERDADGLRIECPLARPLNRVGQKAARADTSRRDLLQWHRSSCASDTTSCVHPTAYGP